MPQATLPFIQYTLLRCNIRKISRHLQAVLHKSCKCSRQYTPPGRSHVLNIYVMPNINKETATSQQQKSEIQAQKLAEARNKLYLSSQDIHLTCRDSHLSCQDIHLTAQDEVYSLLRMLCTGTPACFAKRLLPFIY